MCALFPIITIIPGTMRVADAARLAADTGRKLFITRQGQAVVAHRARRGWATLAVPTERTA